LKQKNLFEAALQLSLGQNQNKELKIVKMWMSFNPSFIIQSMKQKSKQNL